MIVYHVSSDVGRLTDWIIDTTVPNTDKATLSLQDTDIDDVTFVKMAAKLTEKVCTLSHASNQNLIKTFCELTFR